MKERLMVCASCEWMFKGGVMCPSCGFCSYYALSVYGKKAYTYFKTQKYWKERKLSRYESLLDKKIMQNKQEGK